MVVFVGAVVEEFQRCKFHRSECENEFVVAVRDGSIRGIRCIWNIVQGVFAFSEGRSIDGRSDIL